MASKVRVGMVKTKNRKSVIHTGMLRALEQTAEKGKAMDNRKVVAYAVDVDTGRIMWTLWERKDK